MATTWTQVADLSSTTTILSSEALTAILGSAPTVYDNAAAYTPRSLVIDSGELWEALVAATGTTPGTDPSVWKKYTLSGYDDSAVKALIAANEADLTSLRALAGSNKADLAAAVTATTAATTRANAATTTAGDAAAAAAAAQTTADANAVDIATNAGDLSAVKATADANTVTGATLTTGLATASAAATTATTGLASANTDIAAVVATATTNTADIVASKAITDTLRTDVDTNKADIVSATTDVATNTSGIADVRAIADTATTDLVTVTDQATQNAAAITSVKGDIFSAEVSLTEVKDVLSDLITEYPKYYDSSATYAANAVVTHIDCLWIALVPGAQTTVPGTDDTVWKKLNLIEMLMSVAPPATGAPPYDDSVLKASTATNAASLLSLIANDNAAPLVWDAANSYKAGSVVTDPATSTDDIYAAVNDVSAGGTAPGSDTTNWTKLDKGLAELLVAYNNGALTTPHLRLTTLELLLGSVTNPWSATDAYKEGVYVEHKSLLWRTIMDMPAGPEPGDGLPWIRITLGDYFVPMPIETVPEVYDPTKGYVVDSYVLSEENLFLSIIDVPIGTRPGDPVYWKRVTPDAVTHQAQTAEQNTFADAQLFNQVLGLVIPDHEGKVLDSYGDSSYSDPAPAGTVFVYKTEPYELLKSSDTYRPSDYPVTDDGVNFKKITWDAARAAVSRKLSSSTTGMGDDRLVPVSELKSLVAGAADYASFVTAVNALV